MLLEPGHRVGAYEIVGPLGSGGMGEVYQARDTRLGRQVAIKFISDELAADPTAAERLAREARLTSSLNHPNIVTVHDVGEMDGRPYIVMEFVTGQSLHALLASSRMKISRVVDVACQVADGLAAAHGAGVVHRDLKPRNIMVTEDGRAKIVDFGLGKTHGIASGAEDLTFQGRDRGLTGPHVVMGTAGYMAPEQVLNRSIDFRADQFALGGIIYEMVTGRRAFKRDTSVQTMAAIVDDEPEPLMELAPETPIELMTVVERCLAKNPGDRYASTQDLARDLRDVHRILAGSRASWHSGAVRPVPRRRRTRWVVAAAAMLAVTAAGAYALWPSPVDRARTLLERYDKLRNVDAAIAVLEPYVAGRSDDAVAQATLAQAYARKYEHNTKDAALAVRAGEAAGVALKLNDTDALSHVVMALVNNSQKRWHGAILDAQRAIALDSRNSHAWRELGLAYLGLGRLPDAEKALLKAVEFGSQDWTTHQAQGRVYMSESRWADAARSFQRARQITPDNTRPLNNLGSALYRQGKIDEARGMFETSISLEKNATAYTNLGTIYYELGNYDAAAGSIENAMAAQGNTFLHWFNLGAACYWATNMKDRAKFAYEQAVRLGEESRRASPRVIVEDLAPLASSYAVLSLLTSGSASQDHGVAARKLLAVVEQQEGLSADVQFTIASTYEELADRAKALVWFDKAIKAGYPVWKIERSPWLRDLRSDERYKALLKN